MDELSPGERELAEIYDRLRRTLEERGEELPPFAKRNALKALAALWQVTNGLDLDPGQPYGLGA